jgi:hypothetical protein
VSHEEAWTRLPDLLDDRDDAELLAHVRACADCQRQLFLLGRVDRLLRDSATAHEVVRTRHPTMRRLLAAAAAVAAVAVGVLVLVVSDTTRTHDYVLRTPSGRTVAEARIGRSDAHNASLTLNAHGMPVGRGHVFMLWAGDNTSSMQVGRFMVDRNGGCRVRFNLPAVHNWHRFWVTAPANAAAVVAST